MTNTTTAERSTGERRRMKLQYGFNEADHWWHFALGEQHQHIWQELREMDTRVMRLFLFDKHPPDPVKNWDHFAACVQAVLNVGATPMITFAKCGQPYEARALRWFVSRCADVVWGSIEQWGGEVVRDWYWCIWNEPNNELIGGDLSFEQYRRIYEETAQGIWRWLAPYLVDRKPLIGGPAVDGFQPFWLDWIRRFVTEIDNSLIGFVSWHRYGDWRLSGEWDAPEADAHYQELLIAQTPDYEARARTIGRLLRGREILNICGELNVHSHHELHASQRFNQTVFSAAYYASALIHLLRGGVDVEMWWTATENTGPYGVIYKDGTPTPVLQAKKLFAQSIRYGDWISFPTSWSDTQDLDLVTAEGEDGQQSTLLVHLKHETETYTLSESADNWARYHTLLKLDQSTENQVVEMPFEGKVTFKGYGVAVVTNAVFPR